MLRESESAAQINLGDSAALASQPQVDVSQRWQTELHQSQRGFTTVSPNSGAEQHDVNVKQLTGGNKTLDLFPSPVDIWSQTIDSWGKKSDFAKASSGDQQHRTTDIIPVADHQQRPGQSPTPMERLGNAVDKYETGGKKLTPGLRKEFEDIIVASDVPSPLVPGMKQRQIELADEGKKLLTDAKKKEIDDTRRALETSVKALDPERQRKIQGLAQARSMSMGDEKLTRGFEAQMEQVAPGLLAKLKAYEKAVEPVSKIEDEFDAISAQLAQEQGQGIVTRSTYADLLIKDGDKTTAAKHLRDAVTKEPTLLENEEFIELLTGAGLKVSDFKKGGR